MFSVEECSRYEDVGKLSGWCSFPSFEGKTVFVKPNLVVPRTPSETASTTHVSIVRSAIEVIRSSGAREIKVGDCGFKDQWQETVRSTGYDSLEGVELIGLQEKENYHKFSLLRFPNKTDYLSLFGAKFSDHVLECDKIVNLAKLKIHKMARITGTIKNMMGIMTNKGNMHPRCNKDILHKRLRDLYFLIRNRVAFSVIDGIIGSEYAEHTGIPRQSNLVIFADDMWEADVAASKLMGVNPSGVGYLEYIRRDLGRRFEEIEVPAKLIQKYEESLFYCSEYESE